MTNEQNARIASALCGYEVQVSPAGKWYVVTGDETKPMPDFETDSAETLSTAQAISRSRRMLLSAGQEFDDGHWAIIGKARAHRKTTITSALAHCLLQIAEGEE